VKQFIFEHVDSVEQLEIIILLRANATAQWTPQAISDVLRTNPKSVEQRLIQLKRIGIVAEIEETLPKFQYAPKDDEALNRLIIHLDEAYRFRKHSMYELIFSPLKRAREFAAAFTVKKDDGGDHG